MRRMELRLMPRNRVSIVLDQTFQDSIRSIAAVAVCATAFCSPVADSPSPACTKACNAGTAF